MAAKAVAILLWVLVVRNTFSKSTNPPGSQNGVAQFDGACRRLGFGLLRLRISYWSYGASDAIWDIRARSWRILLGVGK